MEIINGFLNNFGWVIAYFMAFLFLLAAVNQICRFFKEVLDWNKTKSYGETFNFWKRNKY